MKKLLAMILCVMLFVSVIPTAAFAGGAAANVPAIDLSPAYTARKTLYGAFGLLGEAHMYKNAITGIKALENKDNKEALEAADGPIAELVTELSKLGGEKTEAELQGYANSYYGLAKKVAPIVVKAWNMAGNIMVAGTAKAIGTYDQATGEWSGMVGGVMTQVQNIVNSFPSTSGNTNP